MQAAVKKGFGLKADGTVFPFNPEAQAWFDMGVNDRLKKRNTKTYQSLMGRMVGIPDDDMPILVRLTDEEKDYAAKLFRSLGADPRKITLGLNAARAYVAASNAGPPKNSPAAGTGWRAAHGKNVISFCSAAGRKGNQRADHEARAPAPGSRHRHRAHAAPLHGRG